MKKKIILGLVILGGVTIACNSESTDKITDIGEVEDNYIDNYPEVYSKATDFFEVLPSEANNLNNPTTEAKIELGKKLYFDVRLSKDNTQSCNTCHNLNTYGVDNNPFSEGNDGELGGRNSPTTLNAALHIAQFWDGREPDVEAQAGGPILNPVEMAMHSEEEVMSKLEAIDEYMDLFDAAFPNAPKLFTYDNLKNAIGVFERQLLTPSKFDDYLAGNTKALTDQEKKGLQTFMDVGCTSCHSGALLGGNSYQKFGTFGNYWELTKSEKIDNGKFDLTQNEGDKYIFKVPSLRNVQKTYPYFHDGSVEDLGEAVKIMAKLQLNKDLTDEETANIVAFLNTLTGDVKEEFKQ